MSDHIYMKNFIECNLLSKNGFNSNRNKDWFIKNNYEHEYNTVYKLTSFFPVEEPFKHRLYCILNNIENVEYCKKCGNITKFDWNKKRFREYCSRNCSNEILGKNENRIRKILETRKYRAENPPPKKITKTFSSKITVTDSYDSYTRILSLLRLEKIIDKNGNVSSWIDRKLSKTLQKEIESATSFIEYDINISDRIKAIQLGLYEQPKCKLCDSPTKYHRSIKKFADTCSAKCGSILGDDKRKETNLQLYGKEYGFIGVNTREDHIRFGKAAQKAIKEKYGVSNVMELNWVREKQKNSLLEYNKNNIREFELGTHGSQQHFNEEQLHVLGNLDMLYKEHVENKIPVTTLSEQHGFSRTFLHKRFVKHGYDIKLFSASYPHQRIMNKLDEYNINYECNNRYIITPRELDIYISSVNLAIEVNGLYWHSVNHDKVDKKHFNKWKECKEKNITLLQFNEWQIENNFDLVISMILSRIGNFNRKIYARNCTIKTVSKQDYKSFCIENHLQGYSSASLVFGLYYNNELLQIMSFDKSRYNKNYEYELIRLCSKKYFTIVGGASRIFSYFVKNYHPNSVVSYSDNFYSSGNVYKNLGFEEIGQAPINYYYTDSRKLESRLKFQKHKLSNLLEKFDPVLTEKQNMLNNGYRIYYGAGNTIFEWNKPT